MMLDTLTLPGNLHWQNQQDFKAGVMTTGRTLTGALLVQYAALQYGQPIVLTGAWITGAELAALQALEASPVTVRTLTLNDGTIHAVIFDIENGGIQASPLYPDVSPDAATLYSVTINLLTVEPTA